MKYFIKRLSLLGTTVGGSVFLAFTGGASANSSITTTGPGSYNVITSNFSSWWSKANNNHLWVNNWSSQNAHSGNANVSGNTNGGSASTGDASNWNSTDTSVSVVNG